MASQSVQIANALKTDIDAETWPVTLTTYREYLGQLSRSDLGSVNRVSIFPYTLTTERSSRSGVAHERGVGLVLRSQVDPNTASEVDEMIETVESLAARYMATPITYDTDKTATPVSVTQISGDQMYDVDRLADGRVFQGGILITYSTRN